MRRDRLIEKEGERERERERERKVCEEANILKGGEGACEE